GTGMLQLARDLDAFAASGYFLRQALRRQIEDQVVTQNLRDGSENQQDPWYNGQYTELVEVFPLLGVDSLTPGWSQLRNDTLWKSELRRHLQDRVTYQIHLRAPNGEWPIPFRGGDKRQAAVGRLFTRDPYSASPEAFADPVNQAILSAG